MPNDPVAIPIALTPTNDRMRGWKLREPEKTAAALMSGGVDSSLAAALLLEAGWDVVGVTLRIPSLSSDAESPCCSDEAVFVAESLGIPHLFLETEEAFAADVIEPFRRAYRQGRTPNPCVDCNTRLKFRRAWSVLEERLGIRHLATGHYARVLEEAGRAFLARAQDLSRDQSYFVYGVPRERLPFLHLPLGELAKDAVRRMARERGLHVAERRDSMELCFAGEGNYRAVLGVEKEGEPGPILDLEGRRIGTHRGIGNYTIGQRRGLGMAAGEPRYVLRIDLASNALVVGTRAEASQREVKAGRLNVLMPDALVPGARLLGKIRSLSDAAPCRLLRFEEDEIAVRFDEPQFGPTPGQHLVLYDESGRVTAGGTILEEKP
ncbi:MAG: tRNA 2-thiouridine(34) synthase MnmA [Planctomycetota bacterium]